MVAREALRRRGFFLHSTDGEPDTGEHENPEGYSVRVRRRSSRRRQLSSATGRFSGRRATHSENDSAEGFPAIRSGSVTGSRQRSHLPR